MKRPYLERSRFIYFIPVKASLTDLTASDNTKFRFDTDGEGNYGYLKADGSFVPFKSSSGDMDLDSSVATYPYFPTSSSGGTIYMGSNCYSAGTYNLAKDKSDLKFLWLAAMIRCNKNTTTNTVTLTIEATTDGTNYTALKTLSGRSTKRTLPGSGELYYVLFDTSVNLLKGTSGVRFKYSGSDSTDTYTYSQYYFKIFK